MNDNSIGLYSKFSRLPIKYSAQNNYGTATTQLSNVCPFPHVPSEMKIVEVQCAASCSCRSVAPGLQKFGWTTSSI